ncbi:MAG: hypothetical protein PHR26_00525 [Candidatus ainarchaeum sp.]|nr:hypothetical protein [Candidatus ainarchaeum sp.]MDD3975793.1 hypothetical protein [Candidatus ainarchaeum sp.]
MDIEIEKSRNDLLKRTNVFVKIRSAKTPNRKELLKKVSAVLGVNDNLIVIDKIVQNFGERISNAYIKVYDDLKTLKELELEYKIKRTGIIEEVKEKIADDTNDDAKDILKEDKE